MSQTTFTKRAFWTNVSPGLNTGIFWYLTINHDQLIGTIQLFLKIPTNSHRYSSALTV